MAAKRIIPCLDVKDARVVKGINFKGLRDMGHPAEMGLRYGQEGADELVFLDIVASEEGRTTREAWVEEVARTLSIPFTVGGGVNSVEGVRRLLRAGADKVALNTAAIADPSLISAAAAVFGRQCVVVAVDVARDPALGWRVYSKGGNVPTGLSAETWLKELEARGAGEILLTSIDRDGTEAGFDLELMDLAASLSIPAIASGGAGSREHFLEAFRHGAEGALAATLFHEERLRIKDLKTYLAQEGVEVRP
jgi:cyclase